MLTGIGFLFCPDCDRRVALRRGDTGRQGVLAPLRRIEADVAEAKARAFGSARPARLICAA